jgi:hypothetical protein
MTRKQIKEMILDVLARADYDLYKAFMPETAEEPEYAAEQLEEIINVAEKHIKKANKKLPAKKVGKKNGA